MTVSDLINSSLRLLGVLASGEVPPAEDQTDAMNSFNMMLDSFSNERLLIYTILREVFTLSGGQTTYTFGTGGNFNSVRPQKIENALIQVPGTNPIAELPITIINKDEYASVIVKAVLSPLPQYLYNDDAFPLTNVNLWPTPSTGTNIVLYSWKPMGNYTSVNTTITLPPGYLRMLRYNLAVELAPEYGLNASDDVIAIALQSKKNVKHMNSKPLYMSMDAAISDRKKGAFNWLKGDTD